MAHESVDAAVIIPDASSVLTLAGIGRIDLFGRFSTPIRIVDQVCYEITKPANDPRGEVLTGLNRPHNQIEIIETNVGVGFQTRRARDPSTPSGNLGEIAVDEYATTLAHTTGPGFVRLVLFEDPDVMTLRIARLKDVHLLNTTAWLLTSYREGLLPEGMELVERINAKRKSPMVPFEKVGLTAKVRSPCLRPMNTRDTPDEETSDWRAVCGRPARTFRRAGRKLPDPYRMSKFSPPNALS